MLEILFVIAVVAAIIALSLSVVSVTKTQQTAVGTQGPQGPQGLRGQTVPGPTGGTGGIGGIGPTGPGGASALLAGDVSGPLMSNTVNFVDGFAAADIGASVTATQSATSNNTPNTLVLRDPSGNLSANNVTTNTISGNLIGSVASVVASVVAAATNEVNAATSAATPSTLVLRDGSGNATFATVNATSVNGNVIGSVGGQSASSVAAATTAVSSATDQATPNTLARRDNNGSITYNVVNATTYLGDFEGTIAGVPAASVAAAATGIASATSASTPNTIVERDGTASASFNIVNATSLNGNVIGQVGGQSASAVASATIDVSNATNAATPSTIMKRDANGDVSARIITATGFIGTFTGNLLGNATSSTTSVTSTNFSGALGGDVSGGQSSTIVNTVGGQPAANIASATSIALAATSTNTPSAVVRRDASGDASLSNINLSGGLIAQGTVQATGFIGPLQGNASSATTATTATTAVNFSNPLGGDVTGNQSTTTVAFVGGVSAALVATGTTMVLAATPNNTPSTIVQRDALGNVTFNQITLISQPVNATDATPKSYVDQIATTGVVPKAPANALAATGIALSGLQTIDGVSLNSGDRVLAIAQTGSGNVDNGIWLAATGTWTRSSDMPTGSAATTAILTILAGTAFGGSQWACSTPQAIVGTDPINFVLISTSNQDVGQNVGVGQGTIYRDKTGNFLNFKTLQQGNFMTITNNANEVNLAVNGTSSNTPSTLVARDANGTFIASGITSSLTGAASSNVLHVGDFMTGDLNMFNQSNVVFSVGTTGSAGIGLHAPASLSGSYSLSLPSTGPGSNQVLAATGTALEWVNAGGAPSVSHLLFVNKAGSDSNDGSLTFPFLTVTKAVTVANTLSSSSTPVAIHVGAGVFAENISGGAIQFTADGISLLGTSILATIITSTTAGDLFMSTTAAFEVAELTLVGQGSGTAFTLTASATANGGFEDVLIQGFGTAVNISSSAGLPIIQFDSVSSLLNTNVLSITNIRAVVRDCAFLGNAVTPAGNAITITGSNGLLTLMATSCRGFAQVVTVDSGSIARISGCPSESCKAGVLVINASTCTMEGSSFVNLPTSGAGISVSVIGAGSSINMVGCLFNHRDVNGNPQGTGVSVSSGGVVAMSGCGVNYAALAVQIGTSNADTNTTQMTCSGVCIRNNTADVQQNGTSVFALVGGVYDDTKVTINDTTNVNIAAFNVSNSNAFSLGSGSDTRNIIYQLLLGDGNMNPALVYEPNYYGGKGSIYENLNTEVTISGVQSASEVWKYAVTTDSSKIAAMKLISDVGTVGVANNLRGWTVAKQGTSGNLTMGYENSDSVGQTLISPNTLSSYDGVNNILNYPFATGGVNNPTHATTQLLWAGDTNLYRSQTGMLQTDTQMTIGSFLTLPNLTTSRAVITDSTTPRLISSVTTSTELGFVSGVTSSIQAQLNSKFGTTGGAFTNPLLGPIGSATGPTYSFSSDPTSGVYYSLTDGLLFSTSGVERMRMALTGEIYLLGLGSGIVHSSGGGQLTSSLIVNADIDPAAAIVDTKLATIQTAGKVSNSATTATSSNTPSAIVARDSSGNITISGLVTNSIQALNLQSAGVVHTDTGGNFSTSLIVNADISASAGIVDTKLATIQTAGKVANSATTANTGPVGNTIALRDNSGNSFFNTLTLSALATGGVVHTNSAGLLSTSLIVNADVDPNAAIVDTKLATIQTAGKVANSATTANTGPVGNTIALRDNSGNSFFNTLTLSALLTGGVVHNAAGGLLSSSLIVNADVDPNAAIVDTKLATIQTAGKVLNSATSANTGPVGNTIALRDPTGSSTFNNLTATGMLFVGSGPFFFSTVSAPTTTSTLTAAQLLGKIVTPNGNNITLTFPTAASIIAAIPNVPVGYTFQCLFQNIGTGNFIAAVNTGLTFARTPANVAQGTSATYWINIASASTVVVYQQL